MHQHHLGSLTAITDDTGAVAELQLYDAWGKRTVPNPTTLVNQYVANGWATPHWAGSGPASADHARSFANAHAANTQDCEMGA